MNQNEPQLLFEASCREDERQKFCFFMYTNLHSPIIILLLIFVTVFSVIPSVIGFMQPDADRSGMAVSMALMVLLYAWVPLSSLISAKNAMKTPKAMQNVNQFLFYEDHFVNNDINSTATERYDMMYMAVETKDYFYIFNSDHSAYIIPKDSFLFGLPEDAGRMLHAKFGSRFRKVRSNII